MPFGSIFGALFFGLCCSLVGLRLLTDPWSVSGLAGALIVSLGLSLSLGLVRRRVWARWAGVLVAVSMVVFSLRLIALHGAVGDHLLLFAALATALLLWVPATGDPLREPGWSASERRLGLSGLTTLASLCGLLLLALSVVVTPPADTDPRRTALPASAMGRTMRWNDFPAGLEQARAEQKPVLVTFVTDWCPYCKKMTKTWREASVIARLEDLVTVRVDAEAQREIDGQSGAGLAARYGVRGYPAQLLLDTEGQVIARYDGYQTASELLSWLDRELKPGPVRDGLARSGG